MIVKKKKMNVIVKRKESNMKKDKKEKDIFGFEKAINFEAINNLSEKDLKRVNEILKKIK